MLLNLDTTAAKIIAVFAGFLFLKYFLVPVYKTFLRPGKNLKKLGDWAIVTGATDGIGKAYAFEFAKKGLNVLLISRTLSKLEDTAKEINAKYPKVQTQVLAINFANFDGPACELTKTKISSLGKIAVLVNNVGVSYDYPEFFNELTDEEVENMIQMNINSTTRMTRIVLPIMEKQKSGAIVNISSAASLITNPMLTLYSATKSYIDKFSLGLNAEYASKGVHIQVQNPLYVKTKLAKMRASLTVPTPQSYVAAAVRAIGYEPQISPFWAHKLQLWIMSLIPSSVMTPQVLGMHKGIKKRALKKKEQQAKSQ